ncbi:MAG: DPP IV N-terminal domain-containing protein, partial [Planctomycetaceae bacterium]|nr:DPP IV N-terminal domain-containing protein [Planctomycetaceae bacterium]
MTASATFRTSPPPHGRSNARTTIAAAVYFLVTAFGLYANAQPPETITWDHVYGLKKISISDPAPRNFEWMNDSEYVQQTSDGWQVVNGTTNQSRPLYDKSVLATALNGVCETEKSKQIAEGGWNVMDARSGTILARDGSNLIRASLDGQKVGRVQNIPGNIELLTLSPAGNAAAFVSQNELWVADFEANALRKLTTGATKDVRNGKADWVYFEEVFQRSWKAFRFSPAGTHLVYLQFDDTHVPTFGVVDHRKIQQQIEVEHFPKAGEANPVVQVGIVPVAGGETVWADLSAFAADDRLVTHINWLPDSSAAYCYVQDRRQTKLAVVRINPQDGLTTVVFQDSTEAWVHVPEELRFLSDGSFLVFSESSGWNHLYRVSLEGVRTAVTKGEWEARSLLAVSSDEQSVIVSGTLDSPIAENAYRVSLTDPEASPMRLTPEDGHHQVKASPHGELLIDSWSSLHRRTSVSIRNSNGHELRQLHQGSTELPSKYQWGKTELLKLPMADGSQTTGIVVWPPDFDSSKKHPVWLMSYGGPHFPGIRDAWKSRLQEQMLASLGIVVIRFDPRSASGISAKHAWLAYRKLGVEETRDVESICAWLKEQSWCDGDRIGMSGYSYGGYFTAYAMTHSKCLCAGIAGAPVTDWKNYDTIYTERYMSTPQDNPDGYRQASVVAAAGNLNGKLLLLHGLRDDNVHSANTFQLVHQLQQKNKQFELMVYPDARHGISGIHYDKLTYNFIV